MSPDSDIKTILSDKGLDRNRELWRQRLTNIRPADVERALSQEPGTYRIQKLTALLSPAAENYLEEMAQLARQLTIQRFGKIIQLYAPLYVSNYCSNSCRYCGFNCDNKFQRTRLTIEQALGEAKIIASEGFRDILLVSGEDRKFITIEYLTELAERLRDSFSSISVEIYQADTSEYAQLFEAGIDGVTLYQETYDRDCYSYYHKQGSKFDYDDRLDTPERIGDAGMRQIGLGVLLGLTDWRIETLALAEHAHYLIKRYWQSHISFSFPRLRPARQIEGELFENLPSDKNMVQMMTALRLCFADAGLVLSTRERARLRDQLIKIGVTKISAGSKTNPGGYSGQNDAVEQFEVDDDRRPAQISEMIKRAGFEPVWKDWDNAFTKDYKMPFSR
ncbi:2-iminoacetate synthase ThiH [Planctomycetota bacterium]